VDLTVFAAIEPTLSSLLVDSARRLASASVADVWQAAWEAREQLGYLETAKPPSVLLVRNICEVARREKGWEASRVLKSALQYGALASNTLADQQVWTTFASPDAALSFPTFGYVGITPRDSRIAKTTEDPFAFDRKLFELLVQAVRAAPSPKVAAVLAPQYAKTHADLFYPAWQARSKMLGWPIREPSRFLVAAVIDAAATLPKSSTYDAIQNKARALLLFTLLGGVLEEPALSIEDTLLALVVSTARYTVDDAWVDTMRKIRAADDVAKQKTQAYRLATLLSEATDVIWDEVVRLRMGRWDLPWPPSPRPDRALLQALILVARMTDSSVANDEVKERALHAIGRFEENLGEIMQSQERPGPSPPQGEGPPADKEGSGVEIVIVIGVLITIGLLIKFYEALVSAAEDFADWLGGGNDDEGGGNEPAPIPKGPEVPVPPDDRPGEGDMPDPTTPPKPKPEPRPRPRPTDVLEPPEWWNPKPPDPAKFPRPEKRPADGLSTDPQRPDYVPLKCGPCEWWIGARFVNYPPVGGMVRHAYINLARPQCDKTNLGFWLFEAGPRDDNKKITGAEVKHYNEILGVQLGGGTWPRPCTDLIGCLTDALERYNSLELPYDAVNGPNSNSFAEQLAFKCGLSAPFAQMIVLPQWDYWRKHPRPF
jgi:hypothetical protein